MRQQCAQKQEKVYRQSNDHFNVFVIDGYVLQTINLLDFVDQVILERLFTHDTQDVMRGSKVCGHECRRGGRAHWLFGVNFQIVDVNSFARAATLPFGIQQIA